jgi:hypothetical protein
LLDLASWLGFFVDDVGNTPNKRGEDVCHPLFFGLGLGLDWRLLAVVVNKLL